MAKCVSADFQNNITVSVGSTTVTQEGQEKDDAKLISSFEVTETMSSAKEMWLAMSVWERLWFIFSAILIGVFITGSALILSELISQWWSDYSTIISRWFAWF